MIDNMNLFHKFLSVVYVLLAVFWGLFTLFGMQLISMGNGNPYEALIIGVAAIAVLVLGAFEGWRTRERRSLLQKSVLYVPGALLFFWIVYTWFVPEEMKLYLHYFFQ